MSSNESGVTRGKSNLPKEEAARAAAKQGNRAWIERLVDTSRRLATEPEVLAAIEKRSF